MAKYRKPTQIDNEEDDETAMRGAREAFPPGLKASGKTKTRNEGVTPGDEEEIVRGSDEKIGHGTGRKTGGAGRDVTRVTAEEQETGRATLPSGNNPHHQDGIGTFGLKKSHPDHPHNHTGAEITKAASKRKPDTDDCEHLAGSRYFGGGDRSY